MRHSINTLLSRGTPEVNILAMSTYTILCGFDLSILLTRMALQALKQGVDYKAYLISYVSQFL